MRSSALRDGRLVTCSYPVPPNDKFPPVGVATIVLKVMTPKNLAEGSNLNNRVEVLINNDQSDPVDEDGDPQDMVPGNNTSQASSVVRTRADLELVKDVGQPDADSRSSGRPESDLPPRIRNNGPSNALNVRVEDIIPGERHSPRTRSAMVSITLPSRTAPASSTAT
ncbi:MAG: hypothetical protein IPG76_08885 [Acidobacteria bacterium]|nr:hypothetical protein [Acidobacteriota bacterium]